MITLAKAPSPQALSLRTGKSFCSVRHVAAKQRSPASAVGIRPLARKAVCHASVNWDAFKQSFDPRLPTSQDINSLATSAVKQYDFVVVGSGIAGLSYALKVAQYGTVAVVTKDYANEGCTQYAQGGVCAVLDALDSVENHVEDTVVAGAHLNNRKAVDVVCREGPARVLELAEMGAQFTRNSDGSLHLTREGGHSNRRIVHAADLTGKEIERALLDQARSMSNIHFYEHHLAVDLVTEELGGVEHCFGVDVLDQQSNRMWRFIALATMLASGGAGQVYPNTTNPHVATGDGMAMAYRAKAAIGNMEFVQFHPTALYDPTAEGQVFLITEAVRGEGGILRNAKGERFMGRYDQRLELAPRDVVARSIHDQLMRSGSKHVWLDISHKDRQEVLSHFPNIAKKCSSLGIDITKDPIPVVPAQHYMCGGVHTGLLGETIIQGLFACGEVTCSGLHGANRLASNSLLEGLVFADRAVGPSVAHAEYSLKHCSQQLQYAAASADFRGSRAARSLTPELEAWVARRREHLRETMWKHCGIVRTQQGLNDALKTIASMFVETKAVYKNYGVSTSLVELMNLVTVGELIVSCALQRKESRGLHYVLDYPYSVDSECRPTLIKESLKKRYDLAAIDIDLAVSSVEGVTILRQPSKKKVQRDVILRSLPQERE